MATYTSPLDFMGTYEGRLDGKIARLSFEQVYEIYPPHGYSYVISFTDLTSGETLTNSGTPLIQNTGTGHILTNIELWKPGSNDKIGFARLLMHTWDIDFISGESVWDGKEFGAFFSRVK